MPGLGRSVRSSNGSSRSETQPDSRSRFYFAKLQLIATSSTMTVTTELEPPGLAGG
jgi:hypothetical protein